MTNGLSWDEVFEYCALWTPWPAISFALGASDYALLGIQVRVESHCHWAYYAGFSGMSLFVCLLWHRPGTPVVDINMEMEDLLLQWLVKLLSKISKKGC